MAFMGVPADIYHRIFSLLLPIPDPSSSPMDNATADEFFKITVPYNVACVCREWRAFALSTPSLWSKFSLLLLDPSDRTLEKTLSFISQHVTRSQNSPLTCTVRIGGAFDEYLRDRIVHLLSEHQRRWGKIHLWFDESRPISTIYIKPRELDLLEDLTISDGTRYIRKKRIT